MSLRLAGPLLLVGAGKMGGALLEGWLRQGLDPAHVFVSDPAPPEDVAAVIASRRIETADFPAKPSAIVIAVKPQLVDETLKVLAPKIGKGTVVLSIAAGRTLASLARSPAEGHGDRAGDAEHRRRYRPQHDSGLRQRCGVARSGA